MSDEPLPDSRIILYQTEDGRTRIQCRFENETAWLTQALLGALTASKEWFMPWRTISSENDKPQVEFELEKVVRGFFPTGSVSGLRAVFHPLRAGRGRDSGQFPLNKNSPSSDSLNGVRS